MLASGAQVEDRRLRAVQTAALAVSLPLVVVTVVGLTVGEPALWLCFAVLSSALASAALLLRAPQQQRSGGRTALPYVVVVLGGVLFGAARNALLDAGLGPVGAAVGGAAVGLGLVVPAALDLLRHRPVPA